MLKMGGVTPSDASALGQSHPSDWMHVFLPLNSEAHDHREQGIQSLSRRRAAVACQKCSLRKVRCNLVTSGPPCTNCKDDNVLCEVVPRKVHRRRKDSRRLEPSRTNQPSAVELSQTSIDPLDHHAPMKNSKPICPLRNKEETLVRDTSSVPSDHSARNDTVNIPASCEPAPRTAVEEGNDYAAALDDVDTLSEAGSLSYLGDKQGLGGFVYEICYPGGSDKSMHYLLPETSRTRLTPEVIAFLRHKGAFTLLPDNVADKLLHTYFLHVHSFFPIIDVPTTLSQYTQKGCQGISELLLWSMFLATANFVDSELLQDAGFNSRTEFKKAMYERAKALYDCDYETDRLLIIQAVILMGLWYTHADPHSGAWHWSGIAIGLCQTLGLHRRPVILLHKKIQLPEARQRLFRRIWWTCVIRDRWLSLVKGRPMRINHEDCDMPMPSADDMTTELEVLPQSVRTDFLPFDFVMVANMWIRLVKISVALGEILRTQYRPNGLRSGAQDVEHCAEELRLCEMDHEIVEQIDKADDHVKLHAYQLQLFYEAAVIVLYRPYVLSGPSSMAPQEQAKWQSTAIQRARTASSNTNNLLEKLIGMGAIRYIRPMIISTMIPAMQIHLFDCKSLDRLSRRVGNHKLAFCMLALAELRDTYWGAELTYRLFERAQKKLSEMLTTPEITLSSGNGIAEGDLNNSQSDSSLTANEAWPYGSYCSVYDQLLSPGFALSEETYQRLLTGSEFPLSNELDYSSVGDLSLDGPLGNSWNWPVAQGL